VADAREPDDATGDLPVPGGTRRRAEEWALVLASQGISSRVLPGDAGYRLEVDPADRARARAALTAYERENAPRPGEPVATDTPEPVGEPGLAGVWVALVLLGCHALATRAAFHEAAYARGVADAHAILAGEWWRTITALFLHADLAHVAGNALFGVYFVSAVTRSLGPGLGLATVLAAGALGNALNAVGHPGGHASLGASTAVFGAIGILAGRALARRNRSGLRGARLLLPVGAGLGLLGMLGTSGARVDLFAHIYGLLAGGLLGVVTQLVLHHRRPGPWAQAAWGAGVLGVLAGAFTLAARGA
jgi:membrane associated rhomboid family serine protease